MSFDPEKITFFAKTDARGQQLPFGIKAKDRQRHMYVVGKTGMGKSTLLENMAAQDIQNGEGMAFIDPHGSAAETLLDYVPEHRINDVIYFAPFDLNNPISFNVMEDVGIDKRHLVVSGLMSTFKKIWVDAWSARMEYILTNALLALIEYPDTTLLSVNRLFSDKAYRTQVVDYIKDPAVKAFWVEEFANYTDRFAAEALPAIQNKIGQFTGNPLIRNIIGQPHSSFDIRKIMDEKKILIMNLSKGLVGETNANLLGSMLTTRIYLGAMSRADLPVHQMKTMPNFYFYVDEFQSFANATFANILSEARKYHLNLIIAHQYISQMEEEVRDAVFGNVGTTVSFRVGPFDAELLETVFTPRFLAADLVNLGFAQIYLTLMIDGIGSQPFSAVTLPPVTRPSVSCKEMVIAASRRNYTTTRDVVEKIITDLHTPVKVERPTPKASPSKPGQAGSGFKAPVSNSQSMPAQRSTEVLQKPVPVPVVAVPVKIEPATTATTTTTTTTTTTAAASATPAVEKVTEQKPNTQSLSGTPRVDSYRREESRPVRHSEPGPRANVTTQPPRRTQTATTENRNTSPKNTDVPASSGRSLDDLRSVLARISSVEKKTDTSSLSREKKPERITPSGKDVLPKADLASALQKIGAVEAPVKKTDQAKNGAVSSSPVLINSDLPVRQTAPVHIDSQPATPPKPMVANSHTTPHHEELRRLAAEAEEAFAKLETTATVAAAKEVKPDDPLAPKKIEQMFRQPRNERSPFTS